jgi:2-octaprenyl-3-methyl-6-methoxy-1,4-benzoquinol hydroxylase/2-octaprenylphenol hydroxylase
VRRELLDVTIAGGGVVGAAAALALARAGFAVALVEPREPPPWRAQDEVDLRVFALAPSSARLLDELGAWRDIAAARAAPYARMQVVDAAGGATLDFSASEHGRAELGWIVENRLLQDRLWRALETASVRRLCPARVAGARAEKDRVVLDLADGATLAARIAVAAEGADSTLRAQAGIDCETRDYAQRAVVAHVRTERAHAGIAWQRFLAGGPLALLPLADGRVSIVWSLPEADAHRILHLDDDAFRDELGVASDFHLGRVLDTTPRAGFPLRLQLARRYRAERLLLLGDAAHVVHPLAGQGVNLGLRDAAELRNVLVDARERGRDIADPDVLARYARRRRSPDTLDARGFDALARVFDWTAPPLVAARGMGLRLLDRVTPLKRALAAHAAGE